MKRVDKEIKKLIELAQSRRWSRDTFLCRVKQLWGKTKQGVKDTAADVKHAEWMRQIGFW